MWEGGAQAPQALQGEIQISPWSVLRAQGCTEACFAQSSAALQTVTLQARRHQQDILHHS